MDRKLPKISVTVPPDLLADLDYLRLRLGVSRSSLISQFLVEGVPHLRRLVESIPESPEAFDLVRFRGESVDIVRERMSALRSLDSDLFSEALRGLDD